MIERGTRQVVGCEHTGADVVAEYEGNASAEYGGWLHLHNYQANGNTDPAADARHVRSILALHDRATETVTERVNWLLVEKENKS